MNKHKRTTILLVLVLIVAVPFIHSLRKANDIGGQSLNKGQGRTEAPHHQHVAESSGKTPKASPRQQGKTSTGPHAWAKPAPPKTFETHILGEVSDGEALVMGGYQLPDGSHEFISMTLTRVNSDGSKATQEDHDDMKQFKVSSMIFSMNPDAVVKTGMDTFNKGHSQGNPYAEAWSQEEMKSTLFSTESAGITEAMNMPGLTMRSGVPGTITFGREGGPLLQVEVTVNETNQGTYSIDSRILHRLSQEP